MKESRRPNESRRRWLAALVAAFGTCAANPLFPAQQSPSRPQPKPYPNGRDPSDQGLEPPTSVDPKAILQANHKKLRDNVSRLYEMVSELKEQVEQTDPNVLLSVAMVKRAQEIESLAKQIKNLAKGS